MLFLRLKLCGCWVMCIIKACSYARTIWHDLQLQGSKLEEGPILILRLFAVPLILRVAIKKNYLISLD